MILYSAGFNSLSSYLEEDINEMTKGYLPSSKSENALFVISKLTDPSASGTTRYETKTSPYLIRITGKKSKGKTIAKLDTLMTMEKGAVLADSRNLRTFLEYIRDNFPADSYGMTVTSHATGWMPSGYFDNPGKYENNEDSYVLRKRSGNVSLPLYIEPEHDSSLPPVKTITQEVEVIGGVQYSHEIEIEDFADAIPMHLDYLLFDACLMGGIEVAYAMKDVADVVGFSPTEVLADGFDYNRIASHLLAKKNPDPKSVCSDYFENYDAKEGSYRSATITLVDSRKIEPVAEICASLFAKYGDRIRSMAAAPVQGYFYRSSKHWHYDLYDIVAKAGATPDELASLQAALDDYIIYKAATPKFFALQLDVFSGLSMYLPSAGSKYLDEFYRSLSWNKATGLVSD